MSETTPDDDAIYSDSVDEWLSAPEAYRKIANQTASPRTNLAIAQRAYAGVIRAKAQVFIYEKQSKTDFEIPKTFWWAGGHEALEQNWETGDFETWIDRKIHLRALGVSFHLGDLRKAFPEIFKRDLIVQDQPTQAAMPQMEPKRTDGRPRSKYWSDWVAELVMYLHEEGFPPGEGAAGQEALISAVEVRLVERGREAPGRTTVQETVRAVLLRYREAGK